MSDTQDEIIHTVDVLLIDSHDFVLLIKRAKPPFEDRVVLPGGHVESDESYVAAAQRELLEETNVYVMLSSLHPLVELDSPDRDPRPGRHVSHVYWARAHVSIFAQVEARSDAKEIHFFLLWEITRAMMGFDHFIAIKALQDLLQTQDPIAL